MLQNSEIVDYKSFHLNLNKRRQAVGRRVQAYRNSGHARFDSENPFDEIGQKNL